MNHTSLNNELTVHDGVAAGNESGRQAIRSLNRDDYRTLALSALGGALEYYDFVIFVFFARALGLLFFPIEIPDWLRQVQTFAIFAIGFLVRPLGGIVVAHVGDLFGRKQTFSFSVLMMAAATLGIGVLPVYSQVGMWAPLALVSLRILQGVALGGEVPGAFVFVSEHVPAQKVGVACGTLTAGISAGILLGSTVATTLNTVFTAVEISGWAWRLPFMCGGVLGLCSVYLRRLLRETPIFSEMQAQQLLAVELPLKVALRDHFGSVVISMSLTGALSSMIVVVILMTPALLQNLHEVPIAEAARANTVATVFLIIGCVTGGAMSDRLGAGRLLIFGSILLSLSSWLFYTAGVSKPHFLVPLYALTGLLVGVAGGIHPYVMVRAFPAAIRFSGLSFSYNIANAIVGGLTPLFISLLLPWIRNAHVYCVILACAVACAIGVRVWRGETM